MEAFKNSWSPMFLSFLASELLIVYKSIDLVAALHAFAQMAICYFCVAAGNGLLPGKKLELALKSLVTVGQHVRSS